MDLDGNLDRHLRGSRRLDLTGVDWEHIRDHPLDAGELRCLVYMMDIESHTMVFLRDLLATRAVEDPRLTSFLAAWCYEELWHGEAFSRFLGEAGVDVEPDRERPRWDDPYPSRVERNVVVRRSLRAHGYVSHIASLVGSAFSPDFPAVHMAWGAVNELSTRTAYERLIARTSNPVLADLLHRVVRDERRHYSFYRVEAERRLAASASARRLTRFALRRLWSIVGTGVRPQAETDFVVVHLFGDADGLRAARAMDAAVDGFPGLRGLGLFERARTEALGRRPPGA
jgi:rubrerythrin